MKRKELVKLLEKNGWRLARSGGNHDIYTNGQKRNQYPTSRNSMNCWQKQSFEGRGEISL